MIDYQTFHQIRHLRDEEKLSAAQIAAALQLDELLNVFSSRLSVTGEQQCIFQFGNSRAVNSCPVSQRCFLPSLTAARDWTILDELGSSFVGSASLAAAAR